MTTTPQETAEAPKQHTWEGDPKQVFHCTTCGLVTTSTDTHFSCQPRPRPAPGPPGP